MFKIIRSASFSGSISLAVNVEVSAMTGLPQETIIGLPDTVLKESRTRIKSAIQLAGFDFPAKSYVINLAPTDIPKRHISLELAICVGILSITNQIRINENHCFIGGVSLDGHVTPVKQLLPLIYFLPNFKTMTFVISAKNEPDIQAIKDLNYIPINHLSELSNTNTMQKKTTIFCPPLPQTSQLSFDEVHGHKLGKLACAFSIIGRHPLLFIGSPGIGKTMLIERIKSILPPLSNEQALANFCFEQLSSDANTYTTTPPFCAPHHSISYAGMVGGKNPPQPGEITRANHGILFLDEIGEYQRQILDTLREPLETKTIMLSRAGSSVRFPADFLLIAAMNPCYCGYYFDHNQTCQCLPTHIQRYWQKLSQPFLDRIAICCVLHKPEEGASSISHKELTSMVTTGISISKKRNPNQKHNAELSRDMILSVSSMNNGTMQLLNQFFEKKNVSMRGQLRLLRLARTIADAHNVTSISSQHVSLAIQLTQHTQLPRVGSGSSR